MLYKTYLKKKQNDVPMRDIKMIFAYSQINGELICSK